MPKYLIRTWHEYEVVVEAEDRSSACHIADNLDLSELTATDGGITVQEEPNDTELGQPIRGYGLPWKPLVKREHDYDEH